MMKFVNDYDSSDEKEIDQADFHDLLSQLSF